MSVQAYMRVVRPISFACIVLFPIALAVLFCFNYFALAWLLVGVFSGALALTWLAHPIAAFFRNERPVRAIFYSCLYLGKLAGIGFCILLLIAILYSVLFVRYGARPPQGTLALSDLRVRVTPIGGESFEVTAQGEAKLEDRHDETNPKDLGMKSYESRVTSTSRGWLLREVRVAPRQMIEADLQVEPPDGADQPPRIVRISKEPRIQLLDFPKDSFYQAKDAQGLARSVYIDKETITWSTLDPDQDVVFAYVPGPYFHALPLLKPLIGVSSVSQAAIALIGLVVSLIVIPIVKPIIVDYAKNRLKSWFQRTPETEPAGELQSKVPAPDPKA